MSESEAEGTRSKHEQLSPHALYNARDVFQPHILSSVTEETLLPVQIERQTRLSGFLQHLISQDADKFRFIRGAEENEEPKKIGVSEVTDAIKTFNHYRESLKQTGEFTDDDLVLFGQTLDAINQLAQAANKVDAMDADQLEVLTTDPRDTLYLPKILERNIKGTTPADFSSRDMLPEVPQKKIS